MLYLDLKSVSLLITRTSHSIREQQQQNLQAYIISVYKMKYSFLIKIGSEN